jgi:hypothetical protein
MSAPISVVKGRIIAVAAALALAAGSALAGPGGGHGGGGGGGFHGGGGGYHGGGGGYHGGGYGGGYRGGYGYRGGWGGHGYYGGRYYGGWHGYYGGWRGGWGWGWGWGCCGIGLGWWLPVLPLGYATYYWGGIPYYYANDSYYVWDANASAYQAVDPPSGLSTTPSSSAATYPGVAASGNWTDLFAYPKGGQSVEQQTRDRDECHKWAVTQTGFDPAQPGGDPKELAAKREAYLRAEGACLEARDYSVK